MKKILMVSLLALLSLSLLLAGCGGTTTPAATTATTTTTTAANQPRDGGELKIIGTEAPQGSIGIPENMRGLASSQIGPMIEPLIIQLASGEIIPMLATSWQWSNSNKTLTLKLRQGVKFHDGTGFDAEAVKWNIDQRMAAKVDGTEVVDSYQVIDSSTFQINITKFQNTWLGKLGGTMGMMISPTNVQKNGAEYVNWHPIGTGPFQFVEYKENDYWLMSRFDGYWGDRPHLDAIRYIFIANAMTAQLSFESGEGNVISVMSGGAQMARDLVPKGFKVETSAGLSFTLIPSPANPNSALANVKVRQAIEYAIDKAKIASTVGLGYWAARYQCVGATQGPYDASFQGRTYDPEMAKKLLSDAGFPGGIQTTIYAGVHLAGDDVPAIQANLKAVGIDATIESISVAKWIDMETNGWTDGLLYSPHSTMVDYGTYLLRYFVKPSGPNWARGIYWTGMAHPDELENAIQDYLVQTDTATMKSQGKAVAKIIFDQALAIPLWETQGVTVVDSKVHDRGVGRWGAARWDYNHAWLSQ
jgi:peptide/nickel transport system substrate-binding protein